MHILEIKDLDFTYQNLSQEVITSPALKKINFSIEENSFTILIGKSGVPQFQKENYSGKVTIQNKEAKNTPVHEIAQEIGLLLQDFEVQLFSTNVILEMRIERMVKILS